MRILIVTPKVGRVATGNRCSANQWMNSIQELGHEVRLWGVDEEFDGVGFDVLVALNAKKSKSSIEIFQAANPDGRVIVVLTGTDIYPEAGESALEAMRKADHLVALQSKAIFQVPVEWREKLSVIVQSATPMRAKELSEEDFNVAVVGHFREVKDPMRTAAAVRLLPDESRVRVWQAGAVLEESYEELIQKESKENARFECLGEVSPNEARSLIAGSDLLVVTSLSEGAGRVVGEAVVNGTPVLSSRIDGVVGLLGDDYSGYFTVGDTEALAELIWKAESDEGFYQELGEACRKVADQFSPEVEKEGWRKLLEELMNGKD